MPTVLYKWDFETGDTQGWVLGSYSSLDSTSQLQGVYSLYLTKYMSTGTSSDLIAYIEGIDLSAANKPYLVLLAKLGMRDLKSAACPDCYHHYNVRVVVKDSAGVKRIDATARAYYSTKNYDNDYKTVAIVFDLTPVAGLSGLRIEIYAETTLNYVAGDIAYWIDNIHIIDGGDREYDIAVLALNNTDKTITFSIPEADRPLPSGVARFAIALATPPHPLSEGTDIFTYTVVCDQGSASITSTDVSNRHASGIVTPSERPAFVNELRVRVYPKTAGSAWHYSDERVVATFWSTGWDLVYVIVFNVSITINPYSPVYQTAMINIRYGGVWTGYRDFDVKIHAKSLAVRCYARFVYGDYTVVQAATVKLEVFSEDYSTKYGESVADLTTGNEARGSVITGLPVDTLLKFRISWTISASARVVIEVRPEFIVY
jgi:hypothetical protein